MRGLHHRRVDLGITDHTPQVKPYEALKLPQYEEYITRFAASNGMQVVGYDGEKDGAKHHYLIPSKEMRKVHSNEGQVWLPWHVDAPHREDSPHFTSLYCVRGERGAITMWASVNELCTKLKPVHLEFLTSPMYLHVPSASWSGEKERVGPAIYKDGDDWCAKFNSATLVPMNIAAQESLTELLKLANSNVSGSIELQAGDHVVMDNRLFIHARTDFKSRENWRRRWLIRTYLRTL